VDEAMLLKLGVRTIIILQIELMEKWDWTCSTNSSLKVVINLVDAKILSSKIMDIDSSKLLHPSGLK
jgi:hypothetical protein